MPKKITEGAKVGFFSPSDPIYPRRIEFIKLGVEILNEWGYFTELIDDTTLNKWGALRPLKERINEVHDKMIDPKIDVLIATWGGKNSSDLLPHLNYNLIRKSRKPIIGTSDIAVLLNAITCYSGLITFHGPNVLGKLNQTKEIGLPLLKDNIKNELNLLGISSNNEMQIYRHGSTTGRLVGGSLGTFTLGLSGTKYMPNFDQIIFFFESASLDYFKTRQHLQHLKLTGFIERVVGVIIGAMTKIDKHLSNDFLNMINHFFADHIPIIKCDVFGHGFYHNPTFPIGMKAKIDTKNHLIICMPVD